MEIRAFLKRLLPEYAWKPYIGLFLYNFFVFYGTRLYNSSIHHIYMMSDADRSIPFCESAIVIYILAFVQWIFCFAVIMRENQNLCREFTWSWFTAETICFLCFSFIPTSMPRPDAYGEGIFAWVTKIVFSADTPDNLFPSIHCIFSWFCFRYSGRCKKMNRIYVIITLIFTLLVMASTLLVKQHVIVDVIGGVITAEIGIAVGRFICRMNKRPRKEMEIH